jgi:hypothetical protein
MDGSYNHKESYTAETKANQFLFIIGNIMFFMAVIQQAIFSRDLTFNAGVLTTLWIIADFCILTRLIPGLGLD